MNSKDTLTSRIWLHLLANGGRWTFAEIGEALGLPQKQVGSVLRYPMREGFFRLYRSQEDRKNGTKVGVTTDCRVPAGVHLNQLLQAINSAGGQA